jgi:hypothetical protein
MAAALYAPDFSSQTGVLRSYDLARGALESGITPAQEQILDVAACPDGRIVAGDSRTGQSGLRIFLDGREETVAPLDLGRPPAAGNGLVCW